VSKEFQDDPSKKYFHAPTEENPHISREWLAAKKANLIKKGEEDVWQREFMAKYVPGGVSKIFSMLNRNDHVMEHDYVIANISRDKRKLHWYITADPAAATVFAVLFIAINPYSQKIWVVDEIYETEQARMSVDQIGREILKKKAKINEYAEWVQTYDEAETWFRNEMSDRFDEFFQPTQKAHNKKDNGLSLAKDILLSKKVMISDRCEKFFWELDNYYKDQTGKIPKKNDHLIDCFRYTLGASYYSLNERGEYKEKDAESFRRRTISDDFPELNDIGEKITDDWSNESWMS